MPEREERRLAAILAADMVGYSRLMEADERGTITRQKAHRRELIDPKIAEHHGRIVKTTGDGLLVEFASVADATECAVAIQQAMVEREGDVPEEARIRYRVGINLGDIYIDGDDILGDGVNVAARLEGLAPPGGVCVSANVRDQIAGKLEVAFEDLGEQHVKNISRPIRVYRIMPGGDGAHAGGPGGEPDAAARPSVAILPLNNMSGDRDQEYFADGLTEDLITALSRFPGLSVIARNSTFIYKGRSVKIQEVGRELGARYVVEGSVRKVADRVRVTVQLIEAATGSHVWAERYDRELTDIFALQDELTESIAATVSGRVESAVAESLKRKQPADLTSYDCLMRAKLAHHRGGPEDNREALELLDKAIERDPGLASAYGWKVCVMAQAWHRGYRPYTAEDSETARRLIEKGIAEDENDLECCRILCEYHMSEGRFDDAQRFHDRAFGLNPNDPRIVAQRGELLTWRGEAAEGAHWVERAMSLDPFNANHWAHLHGRALFGARRYDEAVQAFANARTARTSTQPFVAAAHALAGRAEDAAAAMAELLALKPDFAAADFVGGLYYERGGDRHHLLDGLEKTGLAR